MYDIAFLSSYECYRSAPFISNNIVGGEIVNNFYNISDDGPNSIKTRSQKTNTKDIKYKSLRSRMDISDLGYYPLPINIISRNQIYDRYRPNIVNTIYWG